MKNINTHLENIVNIKNSKENLELEKKKK